jgi:hypothetical protein
MTGEWERIWKEAVGVWPSPGLSVTRRKETLKKTQKTDVV